MASTQTTLRCTYRYDPLDRLINQTQLDTPAHQRFYCKSRLATEIQGATKHSIIQHDDLLLAQQQREGDTLDTTLLITVLQRSVLHTLKKTTQPQPIAYSPYGHRPAFNGLLSLLGFNGERPDPVTGHYLLGNGYRAFNPVLMRFNSPDSWSPFGKGGLNSYAYCLGDPTNQTDPDGHSALSFRMVQTLVMKARQAVARKISSNGRIIAIEEGPERAINTYQLRENTSELGAAHGRSLMYRKEESMSAQHLQNKQFLYDKDNPDKINFGEIPMIEKHLRKHTPEVIRLTYNDSTSIFPGEPEAFDISKLFDVTQRDDVLGPVAKQYAKKVISVFRGPNQKTRADIVRIRDSFFIRKG